MKILRLMLRILLFAVLAIVLSLGALIVQGRGLLTMKQNHPLPELRVAPDSSLIPRGRHLAEIQCVSCHSSNGDLPLSGGREDFLQEPGGPHFGSLLAPNLTPAGRLREYRDVELARAIREGINREDHSLLVMPSRFSHHLSDRDLAALIAYLRSQPAVEHATQVRRTNLLAYLVLGLHLFETSAERPVTVAVPGAPEDSSVAYGDYLVKFVGCRDCHGEDLHGGKQGQFPPIGSNLVQLVRSHGLQEFDHALRGGVAFDGRPLNPTLMPWPTFSRFTDLELVVIYRYLRSLP